MLNINTLSTPGVYIDEVSVFPPSVAAVATAIPAFVGYTAKGELNKPVRISSFPEYEAIFGGAFENDPTIQVRITDTVIDTLNDADVFVSSSRISRDISAEVSSISPSHNLYYAMRLFFDNGGGPCYVVSAGVYTSESDGSVSSGNLVAAINALEEEDEPTIIVVPEAIYLTVQAEYNDVFRTAVNQAAKLKDRFVIMDVIPTAGNVQADVVDGFQAHVDVGDHPEYAAAYYPNLETTIDLNISNLGSKVSIIHEEQTPDGSASAGPEPEFNGDTLTTIIEANKDLLVKQIEQAVKGISLNLPTTPAIAGTYTRVDNERGVWKAPANVSVARVVAPTVKITDDTQGTMNIDPNGGKSVNAIRAFSGRGILVWGARTLDGNDNEWRYISVRRFFNFVEESVKKATYQFVFEPNDANTWNSIRAMIENFLTIQWNQGALQGAKADQAFFVKVGLGQTMTAQDILEGRLIVEIGMAVVRPAEFIILRFMHKLPEA